MVTLFLANQLVRGWPPHQGTEFMLIRAGPYFLPEAEMYSLMAGALSLAPLPPDVAQSGILQVASVRAGSNVGSLQVA